MNKFITYCKIKNIKPSAKAYFIDAMGAMAKGLFASLLIGTILKTLGMLPYMEFFKDIGGYAQAVSGSAMGVAIAHALGAPSLVMYSMAAVGYSANLLGASGGPLSVFFIAIIASEFGKLVAGSTKVDIIVTPLVTITVGCGLSILVSPHIGTLVGYIANFISWSMEKQPFIMGVIVSVVIGMVLTLPISSAAICAALSLGGCVVVNGAVVGIDPALALAGGAAVAGCCCQMVGFAVMSFKVNGVGGLISQGIGTSMLQMPNIIKRPVIWLPTIIVSAITGPLATCLWKLSMYDTATINSGMGTCGFMGPIGIIIGWFGGNYPETVTAFDWVGLFVICFIAPALLCPVLNKLFIKLGLYRYDDLKLEL